MYALNIHIFLACFVSIHEWREWGMRTVRTVNCCTLFYSIRISHKWLSIWIIRQNLFLLCTLVQWNSFSRMWIMCWSPTLSLLKCSSWLSNPKSGNMNFEQIKPLQCETNINTHNSLCIFSFEGCFLFVTSTLAVFTPNLPPKTHTHTLNYSVWNHSQIIDELNIASYAHFSPFGFTVPVHCSTPS